MIQWKTIPFDSAFKDVTSKGNKIPQVEFQRVGKYPIIDQGETFISGYLDDESLAWKAQLPIIIFGDHTRILKFVDFQFILGADGTKVLQPSNELFPKFAYYNLLFLDIPSAGYSRHFRFLKESEIPLPNLDEQKRIAAILDKADRLRRQRRFAQTLSDSFLQSVFIKMFSRQNSRERKMLYEVCSEIFDCKHYTPSYAKKGIPLIKTNDMVAGFFEFGNTVLVSRDDFNKLTDINKPRKGDIVFAREGSFGTASYINDDCEFAIGQRTMLIRANEKQVNPIYLTSFINSPQCQEKLLNISMGTTVKRVNVADVKELPVIIPPLPLQEKFAEIVQKFERVRRQQREATRQAEHLFQTLLHRAYRGEL